MGTSAQKMDSVPSIRRLTRDEWREYRELRLRALADSPDAFTTTLAQAQARDDADWSSQVARGAHSPSEIALVADSDSRLVGLAWSGIDTSDPHRAWLTQMWVDPNLRGLGTGRQLLGAVVRWAVGVDARLIVLSVWPSTTSWPSGESRSPAYSTPLAEPWKSPRRPTRRCGWG